MASRAPGRRGGPAGRWAWVVIVVGMLLPANAAARVRALEVRVQGMASSLYTHGVEESLRQLEQVGNVAADLASGLVRVEARKGSSLDIDRVKRQIEQAGFTIDGECELVAVGRFNFGPQRRITFEILNTTYAYQVLENNQLRRLFQDHPELKGEFVIRLRLHEHRHLKRPVISILDAPELPGPPPAVGP